MSTNTIFLQPRAWTLQLRDLDELHPDLLHIALLLAHSADETGELRVFLKSLALQLGLDGNDAKVERRLRLSLERLRSVGLLLLVDPPRGRGYPSTWQLTRA